jgi:hypothetical protein
LPHTFRTSTKPRKSFVSFSDKEKKEITDMDKIELLELINKGESSFVEFKAPE